MAVWRLLITPLASGSAQKAAEGTGVTPPEGEEMDTVGSAPVVGIAVIKDNVGSPSVGTGSVGDEGGKVGRKKMVGVGRRAGLDRGRLQAESSNKPIKTEKNFL